MSVLKILVFPDPFLREVAKEVRDWNESLLQFSRDMLETMKDEGGIGLAAPQVGQSIRMILVDARPAYVDNSVPPENNSQTLSEEDSDERPPYPTPLESQVPQPLYMINPKILRKKGKTTYEEGCLSVPTFFETVQRSRWIQVEYFDLQGHKNILEVDGLVSIVIQHEIDHLDGILFIDQLSLIKSNKIKSQIKKHGYPENNRKKKKKSSNDSIESKEEFPGESTEDWNESASQKDGDAIENHSSVSLKVEAEHQTSESQYSKRGPKFKKEDHQL